MRPTRKAKVPPGYFCTHVRGSKAMRDTIEAIASETGRSTGAITCEAIAIGMAKLNLEIERDEIRTAWDRAWRVYHGLPATIARPRQRVLLRKILVDVRKDRELPSAHMGYADEIAKLDEDIVRALPTAIAAAGGPDAFAKKVGLPIQTVTRIASAANAGLGEKTRAILVDHLRETGQLTRPKTVVRVNLGLREAMNQKVTMEEATRALLPRAISAAGGMEAFCKAAGTTEHVVTAVLSGGPINAWTKASMRRYMRAEMDAIVATVEHDIERHFRLAKESLSCDVIAGDDEDADQES